LVATMTLLASAACYFIFKQHYAYAAYKLIALNWWCVVVALVAGAECLLGLFRARLARSAAAVSLALLGLFVLGQSQHAARYYCPPSPYHAFRMSEFRHLAELHKRIDGDTCLALIDDWYAHGWAVYYLHEPPVVYPYHSHPYMANYPYSDQARCPD